MVRYSSAKALTAVRIRSQPPNKINKTVNKKNMGEYRLSIYRKWQIILGVCYDGQIVIQLPFVEIRFAVSKNASGTNF